MRADRARSRAPCLDHGRNRHVSSCFPPRFRGGKDVFVSGQHSNTSLIDSLKREELDLTRVPLATGPCEHRQSEVSKMALPRSLRKTITGNQSTTRSRAF